MELEVQCFQCLSVALSSEIIWLYQVQLEKWLVMRTAQGKLTLDHCAPSVRFYAWWTLLGPLQNSLRLPLRTEEGELRGSARQVFWNFFEPEGRAVVCMLHCHITLLAKFLSQDRVWGILMKSYHTVNAREYVLEFQTNLLTLLHNLKFSKSIDVCETVLPGHNFVD